MAQIELADQDLEKVDKLVNSGMFSNRESAIKGILENLPAFEEDIKRMEKAKHEASMFLEIYMGNMLYPGTPVKIVIDGKEMYKIPVKSVSLDTNHILSYTYVDSRTLEVDADLSTGLQSLPGMDDEELEELKEVQTIANSYCESNLDGIYAGVPRKLDLEGEEEFEVVVKGKFSGKTWICGYLFLDVNTLTVKEAAIDRKRIEKLKAGEAINEGSLP